MIFYGLKTCDTCRRALKELSAAGVDFEGVDVRADGVSADKLKGWTEKTDWQKLLNTRSTTWGGLDEADKADVTVEKAIALMAAHPTLIKRPVIEMNDALYVGWTPATKAAVL
jgi:arsenate reductase